MRATDGHKPTAHASSAAFIGMPRAKPLAVPRFVDTKRGRRYYMVELGTNVRRIVRFPHPVKPAEPKQAG